MKEGRKHIARTMCLMVLVVLLCGCGKEQDVSDSRPAGVGSGDLPEGYVFFARFEDAGGETKTMHAVSLVGSSLYYCTNVYDAERSRLVWDVYVQEQEKETRQLLSFGYEDAKSLRAMTVREDGSLYLLYSEGTEGDESQNYTLEKRDQELKVVYSVDTTEGMEDISGIYDMEAGADGALYGLTLRGEVLCWDEATGMYQGRFTLPERGATANGVGVVNAPQQICFGLSNAGSSGVYAYWAGKEPETGSGVHLYDLKEWREMDDAARETAEPFRLDLKTEAELAASGSNGTFFVFSGYENGLYMADQYRLWQIDMRDGSLKPLLAWEEISLKPWYVRDIRRQEDGGFLMYVFDTLEQENYWVTLNPVPESELPEKHELVLGVAKRMGEVKSLTSKIDQVVLSFNRTHPYCHVTVREYEENNVTNFQLELLTGKGPDILLELQSFFDMETLVGKGIVEDLAPYLAKAEGISEEDILPGILRLVEKDGKIPRIPLSFSVQIMVLPEGIGQEVMTPQEMAEYMAGSEYHDYLINPMDLLCDILSGAEMDHYVNKEQKSCTFDSEEFVSLLESLKKLNSLERPSERGKRAELFRSGKLSAVVEEMENLRDYFCAREAFSGVGRITGFPNSSGELRYPVRLYDWMGINSATEYKEDAWSFIEFCLSYMSRADDIADRFVVTKDKFERQTRLEEELNYMIGVWNDYNENWNNRQKIAPMTMEETELLREISEHLYFYEDDALLKVIQEESRVFFISGDISAQEAAERIQNRASLIVGE